MTAPADEIRTAADKLRALADRATEPPWSTKWNAQEYELVAPSRPYPIAEWTYAIATIEPKASEHRAECDTADADYIAAMHPGVGKALADWLEEEAKRHDAAIAAAANIWGSTSHADALAWLDTGAGKPSPSALTVARAINGGEPS